MSDAPERGIAAPLPDISERMRPFWVSAAQGRFVLPRCPDCGAAHFPAVEICPECLSKRGAEWVEASGRGVVFSFVVMHQVYHPAFAGEVPYAVVDVRLAEGPRVITQLVDIQPSDIRVGMPVEVAFVRRSDTIHLPMFRPAAR